MPVAPPRLEKQSILTEQLGSRAKITSWRSSLLLLATRSGNSSGSRRALTLDDCAAVPATIRRETSMLRERASVRWKDFSVALAKQVWLKPFRSRRTVLRVLELCASGGVITACGFVLNCGCGALISFDYILCVVPSPLC